MKKQTIQGSENYQCQVIKLPTKITIPTLDNLVEVNYLGNSCLVGKEYSENDVYLFFPCECKIHHDYLHANNLYRHANLNRDNTKTGFFEDNGRVKAIKFKEVISTGFIAPLDTLQPLLNTNGFNIGDEFNSIDGHVLCEKFIKKVKNPGTSNKLSKLLDSVIDSKHAPEHPDTSHLLKNVHKLSLEDYIAVTYKLHGCSFRVYNTLIKKKLTRLEKVARWFGAKIKEDTYEYVAASRRVIKSVGFDALPNKNHYFSEDLWSKVGKEFFEGKLLKGEAVYAEIIGKTYDGAAIQHGYTYGLNKPKVYIYRISLINEQGVEIDLSYQQMKIRAKQLGIEVCPELFYGKVWEFVAENTKLDEKEYTLEQLLSDVFYNNLLEKPSVLDNSVVEEGFCIRTDCYPKTEIYKIKSKKFLLHESKALDKEVADIEVEG